MSDLSVSFVPADSLRLDPNNARKHGRRNLEAIEASLRQFGQRRPLIVMPDMTVIAGNGTLEAIRSLGWGEVAVTVVPEDWTAEQARAYALADNRTAELADWDEVVLLESLTDLTAAGWDIGGIGWNDRDLVRLGASIAVVEDEAPEPPANPVSREGDLWRLGRHQLVVGDSREPAQVARLGEASCMWTDPPYGVEYVGKTKDALTIDNDTPAQIPDLLARAFASADSVLAPSSAVYVAAPAGPLEAMFLQAFIAAGWQLRQVLVWVKDSIVLGHSDYHYAHEPMVYGYTAGKGRRGRGHSGWFGDDKQSSVFQIPRPARNAEHPTMKPVELVARCIANSTKVGGRVLDPFAGSGTTMIAAEQTDRAAACVELDPAYADVIVERWQTLTGERATRENG